MAAAVAILLALGACGSDEAEPTATGGTTTAGGTADAAGAATWAGDMCTASDELQASVDAIGSNLSVDLGSSFAAEEQVKAQLRDQVQEVAKDAGALREAIAALPPEADPDVEAASTSLDDSRAQLQESVDELTSAADTFDKASDVPSAVTAIAGVSTAFTAARSAAVSLKDDLKELSASGATAVQQAFQDAPECAGYVSTS
jgi:hypothetical protein